MSRFFIDSRYVNTCCISGQDARHIVQVLRKRPGDTIELVFQDGQVYAGTIAAISTDQIIVEAKEKVSLCTEPPIKVILAQGLPKADKFEWVVQKAVELGVGEIVGLELTNCVARYDETKKIGRVKRWQKIAYEAAKQCGRGYVPHVSGIYSLKEFLETIHNNGDIILFYEKAFAKSLKGVLKEIAAPTIILIIGPEGGFTNDEVELCKAYGAKTAGLGSRILRTETAALTALSVVMYELGDLGGGR